MTYEIIQRTTVYDYEELHEHAQEKAWFTYICQDVSFYLDFEWRELNDCIMNFCNQTGIEHVWYNAHGPGTEKSSFCEIDAQSVAEHLDRDVTRRAENNGYFYSIDICDTWNAYVDEKRALFDMFAGLLEDSDEELAESAHVRLNALLREGARLVSQTIDELWETEKDWITSREYFEENIALENWYTCDGLTAYPHEQYDAIAC